MSAEVRIPATEIQVGPYQSGQGWPVHMTWLITFSFPNTEAQASALLKG